MRESLQVAAELSGARSVIVLAGDCDEDTEPLLDETLARALDSAPGILEVDVAGVGFADSTLLHALLRGLDAQRARQGRFILRGPLSAGVERLLIATGTLKVFQGCLESGVRTENDVQSESGDASRNEECRS
ncbi:STAS domain-containing protein [Streptomyces sp. SID8379]|uniref:STAS domain-containing protein n=1 Tax=unclassified Streptomyces TaxID=2593676 RepID=UPI0003690031|nr:MULTISPECIES: STAS domain-containing protein [unclassified Streptomyces]MYW70094.1 STAS domain-containing protein [Streptomyces sp. SID8379]